MPFFFLKMFFSSYNKMVIWMKLFSDFTDLKIYICNQNQIRIENYNKLKEISKNTIYIDKLVIKGNNLLIKEINDITIYIEGVLNEIIFNN